MVGTTVVDRGAQALSRAFGYWDEQHRERETAAGLTVALAREEGTPADEVAAEVARHLGWRVYDHELPEQLAREMGMPLSVLDRIDERGQSWLVECLEGLSSRPHVSEWDYLRRLVRLVLKLGEVGNCVIVGHGASQILPPLSTLRVELVGAREDRVAALMRRLRLSRHQAERRADQLGRERTRFIWGHFHADPTAVDGYDLIVNSSRWSVPECADLIVQALHRKAGHKES